MPASRGFGIPPPAGAESELRRESRVVSASLLLLLARRSEPVEPLVSARNFPNVGKLLEARAVETFLGTNVRDHRNRRNNVFPMFFDQNMS